MFGTINLNWIQAVDFIVSVKNAKKAGVRAKFSPTGVVFITPWTGIEQTPGFEVFCARNRNLLPDCG